MRDHEGRAALHEEAESCWIMAWYSESRDDVARCPTQAYVGFEWESSSTGQSRPRCSIPFSCDPFRFRSPLVPRLAPVGTVVKAAPFRVFKSQSSGVAGSSLYRIGRSHSSPPAALECGTVRYVGAEIFLFRTRGTGLCGATGDKGKKYELTASSGLRCGSRPY